MTEAESAWFLQWMDSNGLQSGQDVEKALKKQRYRASLWEFGKEVFENPSAPPEWTPSSVVMGSRLDLTADNGGCMDADCLRGELDNAVRRSWHYFDDIWVAGFSPQTVSSLLSRDDRESCAQMLGKYGNLLLDIRGSSLGDYIKFRHKMTLACFIYPNMPAKAALQI